MVCRDSKDANNQINKAATLGLNKGNNLTRPSLIELDAAEKFVSLIKSPIWLNLRKMGQQLSQQQSN